MRSIRVLAVLAALFLAAALPVRSDDKDHRFEILVGAASTFSSTVTIEDKSFAPPLRVDRRGNYGAAPLVGLRYVNQHGAPAEWSIELSAFKASADTVEVKVFNLATAVGGAWRPSKKNPGSPWRAYAAFDLYLTHSEIRVDRGAEFTFDYSESNLNYGYGAHLGGRYDRPKGPSWFLEGRLFIGKADTHETFEIFGGPFRRVDASLDGFHLVSGMAFRF